LGLDAWQNRIRYAVSSNAVALVGCTGTSTQPHFTNATNLRANGITCQPGDLVICNKSPAAPAATTCDAGTAVSNQNTVVAIIFSTGKNGATGGTRREMARQRHPNTRFFCQNPRPPRSPCRRRAHPQALSRPP